MPDADIARLGAAVESFVATIDALPAAQLRPAAWGAREILAHLVYWHEHYVRIVRARLAGREPRLPAGSFVALNAEALARFQRVPVASMLARFVAAQRKLERMSDRAVAARVKVRIKTGAMARPWRVFIRRVEAHIRGHERHVRRMARSSRAPT